MRNNLKFSTLYKKAIKNRKELYEWINYLSTRYPYSTLREFEWFQRIKGVINESENVCRRYNYLRLENESLKELPRINMYFFEGILREDTKDKLVFILENALRNIEEILTSLYFILKPELSENEKQKISSLWNELEKMKGGVSNDWLIKNLEESLKEAESNHFLASSIISSRIAVYCISKIKGANDDEKERELRRYNIIPKDEKSEETKKWFLKASRAMRNALNHKIDFFPLPSEMFSFLGDSFKIVKLFEEYKKSEESKNE